jgi:hypothetical protein
MLDRAAGEALLAKLDEFAAELARFRDPVSAAAEYGAQFQKRHRELRQPRGGAGPA